LQDIISGLNEAVPQKQAESIIARLYDNDLISYQEKELMETAVNRRIINVELPYRDLIRSRILKGMLKVILKNLDEED